jgi:spore photoproduct lyase
MAFPIKAIIVEKTVRTSEMTRRVLRALPDLPVHWVDQEPLPPAGLSVADSRKILFLTRFRGELVKPCPGTKDYICCGYQILHFGSNCPIRCSYCILQAYFNQPYLRLFANTDELFDSLDAYVQSREGEVVRLGTGEFTDSLALDDLTGFSTLLLEKVSSYPNVVVELKTKTDSIEGVLKKGFSKNIILSWSLNPPEVVSKEELGAAPLASRLKAAAAGREKGLLLGFHFDPLFYFPGWEAAYERTVRDLFRHVRAEQIAWISLGCFRFMPPLKPMIRERWPRSRYIYGEFIPALDGKMRYVQPIRVAMYRKMLEWISREGGNFPVYLCMENPSVWARVFGFVPGEGTPTLSRMLDRRIEEWFKDKG